MTAVEMSPEGFQLARALAQVAMLEDILEQKDAEIETLKWHLKKALELASV